MWIKETFMFEPLQHRKILNTNWEMNKATIHDGISRTPIKVTLNTTKKHFLVIYMFNFFLKVQQLFKLTEFSHKIKKLHKFTLKHFCAFRTNFFNQLVLQYSRKFPAIAFKDVQKSPLKKKKNECLFHFS